MKIKCYTGPSWKTVLIRFLTSLAIVALLIFVIIPTIFNKRSFGVSNAETCEVSGAELKKVVATLPAELAMAPEINNRDIIISFAKIYGVDPEQALAVAECESQFIESKIGDKGTSFGVWQFHLIDHPEISKKCALDVRCSTFQAMEHWVKNPKIWSCYHLKILHEYFSNEKRVWVKY